MTGFQWDGTGSKPDRGGKLQWKWEHDKQYNVAEL